MIAYPPCPCAGCRSYATREVIDDDGEPLPLCDRCPSPEEIQRRTAEVRANWDELDYWSRQYGLPRDLAETLRGVSADEVPVVRRSLPVRHGKPIAPTEL